jgi:hypothetical protein
VDEAIADSVGMGGLPDQIVAAFDRHLAGDEGEGAFGAILAEPGLTDAGGADQEQLATLGDPALAGALVRK